MAKNLFLDASSHLYKRVYPSVGPSPVIFKIEKNEGFFLVYYQGGPGTSQKCRIASLQQGPESHTFLLTTHLDIDIATKRHILSSFDIGPDRGRHMPTRIDVWSQQTIIWKKCNRDQRYKGSLLDYGNLCYSLFLHSFILSLTHSFIYLPIRSFIHSSAYSASSIYSIMTLLWCSQMM